jgi:hypothetical protein
VVGVRPRAPTGQHAGARGRTPATGKRSIVCKVILSPIPPKVEILYENTRLSLPKDYTDTIGRHWQKLIDFGRKLRRGDVYTIVKKEENPESLRLFVQLTDYAHYMYTLDSNFSHPLACRVIHTALLIETSDRYLVFGEMAEQTSTPGRLQCVGGGIDQSDIKGDRIDLTNNIVNEAEEEIGLDLNDNVIVSSVSPKYLKSGGDSGFLAMIYSAQLSLTIEELELRFREHTEALKSTGRMPEFSAIASVKRVPDAVRAFLRDDKRPRVDYLEPLLEIESGS